MRWGWRSKSNGGENAQGIVTPSQSGQFGSGIAGIVVNAGDVGGAHFAEVIEMDGSECAQGGGESLAVCGRSWIGEAQAQCLIDATTKIDCTAVAFLPRKIRHPNWRRYAILIVLGSSAVGGPGAGHYSEGDIRRRAVRDHLRERAADYRAAPVAESIYASLRC